MSGDKEAGNVPTGLKKEDQSGMEPDPELQVAVEKLSRKNPNEVTEILAMMGAGPMSNPLHQKMNEEHITQILTLATRHDERQYDLHKNSQSDGANENVSNRRYTFAAFCILIALIIIVLVLFKDSPSILLPVMSGIGGLVGGFFGGWGWGRSKSNPADK